MPPPASICARAGLKGWPSAPTIVTLEDMANEKESAAAHARVELTDFEPSPCAKLTDSYLEPVESSRYACCASASARSSCARGIPANTPVVVFKYSVLSRVPPTSAPVIFWGVQPPRPAPPVSVPSAVTLPARVQSHPRVCLTSSPDAAGRTAPHTHTRGSPALHSRARVTRYAAARESHPSRHSRQ